MQSEFRFVVTPHEYSYEQNKVDDLGVTCPALQLVGSIDALHRNAQSVEYSLKTSARESREVSNTKPVPKVQQVVSLELHTKKCQAFQVQL